MRFLEILFCVILFPMMLILGLILGTAICYKNFDKSFWKTINKGEKDE